MSRKLSLYILLALTVSMVSQIRAYFIRGSIYKKGSQYIVLLGDWHWVNFLSQKYELIESLKLFNQKQMVTLLEDPDDDDLLKHNKAYISSKQIISSKVDAQNCGPVPTLCSDLKKENVNAIGIENRKIILAFYNELCTTEQLEYIRLESGQLKSGLTIDHMHNEMRNNITAANMFLKKIISDNNKTILQYCKSKLDKITNSYRKFIKELESQEVATITDLIDDPSYMGGIFDINLIQTILENKNKKIIVVCAGLLHTVEIENFIKKIDYKLVSQAGLSKEVDINQFAETVMNPAIDKITESSSYKMSNVSWDVRKNIPKPIDIVRLFKILNPKKKSIVPYKYGRFAIPAHPVRERRHDLFWQAAIARPLRNTSQIIKNQIIVNKNNQSNFCKRQIHQLCDQNIK